MPTDNFTFTRDWTHAGKTYAKGDTATLSATTARMLAEAGAGEERRTVDEEPAGRWRHKPKS